MAIYLFIGWENSQHSPKRRQHTKERSSCGLHLHLDHARRVTLLTRLDRGWASRTTDQLEWCGDPFISVAKEAFAVLLLLRLPGRMTSTLGCIDRRYQLQRG